jgi:8-oxo-dGTP diphosphatase
MEGTTSMTSSSPAQSARACFRIGVFAIIERDGHYLLARRRDIGWWNLAGGGLEAGETVDEGLAREVREEIGVEIEIVRLVGVYSKPRKQEVVLAFLCRLRDPQARPTTSDEVSEVAWFLPEALPTDLLPKHRQRLEDVLLGHPEAVVRAQRSSTEEDQGLPGKG